MGPDSFKAPPLPPCLPRRGAAARERLKGHRPRNLEPPSMTIPAIVAILVFLAAFLVLNRIEFGRFD